MVIMSNVMTLASDAMTLASNAITLASDAMTLASDAMTLASDAMTLASDAITLASDAITFIFDVLGSINQCFSWDFHSVRRKSAVESHFEATCHRSLAPIVAAARCLVSVLGSSGYSG